MHLLTPRPKVVFFDYGDTLMRGNPPYLHRIAHALREGGFAVDEDAAEQAGHQADYACYEAWKAGDLNLDDAALPVFVQHVLRHLALPPLLLADRPDIVQRFFALNAERELTLFPDARGLLDALRARGYRLGVISNNDGSCAEKCAAMGIASYFDVIVDSAVEGVRKPGPDIFLRACAYMDVAPADAVHVGDMYGADVCGAAEAGLRSIWMNFRGLPRPGARRPAAEVASLSDVAACLP